MDERAFIDEVEHAEIAQFSRLIARPTAHEEEILVAYLGEERYSRMHERSLQRNLRRADAPPLGNVVVLHGVMGAELSLIDRSSGNTPIWPHALRLLGGGIERLELEEEGVAPAHPGDDCDATGILKRYYGELLLKLSERWRTRAFFYDWRKPLATAAQDLAARIAHWFPADEPVHFVAHSTGGLVARAFIAADGERWKAMEKGVKSGRGGRLIMLGTPNHGTYGLARVLTGLDPIVRRLALREGIAPAAMARILSTFPSLYQMLPSPLEDKRAALLYQARTWPVTVSQVHLDAAREQHEALREIVDVNRMVYVAGGNVPTYVSVDPARLGMPVAYGLSRAGDGRVSHKLGLLTNGSESVRTYYADASHGDLTSHRHVLAALDDLLLTGETELLPNTFSEVRSAKNQLATQVEQHDNESDRELQALLNQIATRERGLTAPRRGMAAAARDGAHPDADAPPARVSAQERHLEDNLLRDFLGANQVATPATSRIARPALHVPKVTVVLRQLDIADAHKKVDARMPVDVIAVGHYTGVKPQAAEKALDEALSAKLQSDPSSVDGGVLTDLTLRGTIGGGLGQPFFLDDPRDESAGRRRMICLAGLGLPGRFGAGDLVVVVRELCWASGRLGRRHVASVLIGAGTGNLSERTAIACWLRGIGEALAGHDAHAPRVERVTLVELDPARLVKIDEALKQVGDRLRKDRVIDITYRPLSEKDRDRLGGEAAEVRGRAEPENRRSNDELLPTRITLTRDGRTFRFGAITATAAVPERDIPVDPILVGEANDQLAAEPDTERRREGGRFLGRLLLPRDLRDQLEGDAPVVMILDSTSARIHWELVARWPGDEPGAAAQIDPNRDFLGVSAGFTRQLRTTFAPPPEPPPPPERLLRVLVVADPAEDAHLPGAEEEGIEVANLFERLNRPGETPKVEVVRLLGPRRATRTEVMRHLIMRRFHIMHFAGHCAYVEGNSAASGWVFTGGARLSASELRRIDRVPEFIFSNACESGVTPDRAGNRSAGLAPSFAEAFFERGVGNLVCTAWPVNDGAARLFATTLYGALLGLDEPASGPQPMYLAMRDARKTVAGTADGERSWGAYQHYGDPLYRLLAPTVQRYKPDEPGPENGNAAAALKPAAPIPDAPQPVS